MVVGWSGGSTGCWLFLSTGDHLATDRQFHVSFFSDASSMLLSSPIPFDFVILHPSNTLKFENVKSYLNLTNYWFFLRFVT